MKLQRKPVRMTGPLGACVLWMLLLAGCAEQSPEPRDDAMPEPTGSGATATSIAEPDPAGQQAARARSG